MMPISINASRRGRIVLAFSFLTLLFWRFAHTFNPYAFAVSGAVFELLWLPMLVSLIALPVYAFLSWRKEKFSVWSLYLYSLVICLATALWLWKMG